MLKLILIVVSLIGCANPFIKKKETKQQNTLVELAEKSETYLDLIQYKKDQHGFIMTDKCDSLLFSALLSAAENGKAYILAARDSTGAWHRRPNHDCSPTIGNSRSTISRDMILGLFWHLWRAKDLQTAIELMDDLRSNAYKLRGQGTLGELLVNPSMVSTLAHIILKLGGPRYPIELSARADFGKQPGFIAHLTVWHILLRGEVWGELPQKHVDILSYHMQRQPMNPLFQAAYHKYSDGDQSAAVGLLLDSEEWPAELLPTNQQHCSEWPIERDYTEKDWGPCAQQKHHTGAELPIIYELVIKN